MPILVNRFCVDICMYVSVVGIYIYIYVYIFVFDRPSKSTLTVHDQFETPLGQALMSRSGPAFPLTDRTLKLVTGRGTTPSVMRSLVFLLAFLINGLRGSPQHATKRIFKKALFKSFGRHMVL